MKILGIETSCDETAAAVVENGRTVLSSEVYSQIALHAQYGGVVPEIASRKHMEKISLVADAAIKAAHTAKGEIDAIAVTAGPGLIGALLTGLSFAKAAAYALDIPLIPVHHIKAHVAALYLSTPSPEPPFICAVVSGGHTLFLDVLSYDTVRVLGSTKDDAAGELFDKTARVLGYPYPGGKALDELAKTAAKDTPRYPLPLPKFDDAPLDCSFSGLKTAVINTVHNTRAKKDESLDTAALALSIMDAVSYIIVSRTVLAAKLHNRRTIALSGGVAANSFLRQELRAASAAHDLELFLPPLHLCGDNAAMVAAAGYFDHLGGSVAHLSQNAFSSLSPEVDMAHINSR